MPSVHGISGNIGWAVAPVLSIGLMNATGNWRAAYAGTALVALVVLGDLWLGRAAIDDRQGSWGHAKPAPGAKEEHPLAFPEAARGLLCFSFFFWTTMALTAIQ